MCHGASHSGIRWKIWIGLRRKADDWRAIIRADGLAWLHIAAHPGDDLYANRLHELSGFTPQMLVASARDVLSSAGRQVEIVGPLYEAEAASLFEEGVV